MTLRIHVAPHPDALVAMLCERLIAEPLDPFTPETVAVPTRGIERWLTQRIGVELTEVAGGISAHVEFPSPRQLVRSIVDGVPALGASLGAWEGAALQTVVMACIDDDLDQPWMSLLRRHLASPAVSRMAAAAKITRLFSAYARRRPAMITAWADGGDVGPDLMDISEHHRWQPKLWRHVRHRAGVPAPAELLASALDPIRDGVVPLPERISVYGLTGADPFDLAVLGAVAHTTDVLVHVLHPSPALWSDIAADPPTSRQGAADRARHPLLAAWGRDSRELQLVLAAADRQVRHAPPVAETATLLGSLQADIRANRRPRHVAADRSIQIHVCHGARRQVEVLRDAVLHILAADRTLEPRDIVIMTPDLATFAPLLEAGFPQGDGAGLPDLRVRIADRSPAATNPLVRFASGVLDLADGRLDASTVRELVARPVVQQRFGFDGDLARSITSIVDDAAIAWGLDPAHRQWWGVSGVAERTWRRGLDRALAGVFYLDSPVRVVGAVSPLDGVEGQDTRAVGILAAIIDRIGAIRATLSGRLPMSAWATAIGDATRMLADPGFDGEWQWVQLERLLVETFPATGAVDPPVTLSEARRAMAAWTDDRPSPLHFRTGDVTVCTLAPMRSVPYRVVCLLGMDHDRFPRRTRTDGDDLLAGHESIGDHDRSGEDRQLLLDAVIAAGDHLVITYAGRDEITNAEYPPAVPIAELLDTLATMTERPIAELQTRHPLQSFSQAVFTDGALGVDGPWGFDPIQLRGALAVQRRDQLALPMTREWVGTEPPEVVRIDDLVWFLANPMRGFVRSSLGFGIPSLADLPDDALPVSLTGLQSWALKDRLLDGLAVGHDLDALIARELGADSLPPGSLATRELDYARRDVEQLWGAAVQRGYHQPRHRWYRGELAVAGRLVEGSVLADPESAHVPLVTPSKVKASHRLGVLVRLAFLTLVDPSLPWHGLILARRATGRGLQETTIGPFGGSAEERTATALGVLEGLVSVFDDGHRRPMALPCETALCFQRQAPTNRAQAIRDARAEFEKRDFGENRDASLRLLFGDVDTITQLLATDFEVQAERLWAPVLSWIKERGA
ncbi:MAG: exodeoxyribonuclease V subunit gamma [Acidimicrobiia bacterium]